MEIIATLKEHIFSSSMVAQFIGYTIAIVLGHFVINKLVRELWRSAGWERPENEITLSATLGGIERVLYLAALQLGYATFIALWLGLKTSGIWTTWQRGLPRRSAENRRRFISGRQIFNIFLVGNALNIVFAVLGERVIHWLTSSAIGWTTAVVSTATTLVACLLVLLFVKKNP